MHSRLPNRPGPHRSGQAQSAHSLNAWCSGPGQPRAAHAGRAGVGTVASAAGDALAAGHESHRPRPAGAGRKIVALTPRGSATARVVALAAAPHCYIDPSAADAQFDLILADFLATPHPVTAPSDMFLSAFDARARADQLGVIRYATAASRLAQAPTFRQDINDWRHQCAD